MKNLLLLLTACMLGSSCIRDVDTAIVKPNIADEKVSVDFTVATPAPARLGTRAVDLSYENDIHNLLIFVMKENEGDEYIFDSLIRVNETSIRKIDAKTNSFTLAMEPSETPVKFMIIANLDNIIQAGAKAEVITGDEDLTAEEYVERFYSPDTYTGRTDVDIRNMSSSSLYLYGVGLFDAPPTMPMSGEVTIPSLNLSENRTINIPVMRTAARVDVQFDLTSDSKSFAPAEVMIYRPTIPMNLFPYPENIDSEKPTRVIRPSLQPDATYLNARLLTLPVDSTTGLVANTYVSEHPAIVNLEDQITKTTCIVVGGYFNGSAELSYYRLDFNSGLQGHPFGQILRNYRYVFNVTEVSSPGFTDPGDAANSMSRSIEVEVVPWEDNMTNVVFPGTGDYFTTNDSSLTLPYEAATTGQIEISSTMDFAAVLDDEQLLSTDVDAGTTTQIDNGLFGITIIRTEVDSSLELPVSKYSVTVQALTQNTDNTNASQLVFNVGGGALTVNISQNELPTYVEPRILNVYSLRNTYGDMGQTIPPLAATTDVDALRNMLLDTSMFGPEGIVGIDDIIFTHDTELGDTAFDQDSDAPTLRMTLRNVDVLIIPGYGYTAANEPSPLCAQAILDWAADPTHTLILTVDQPESNRGLRNALSSKVGYNFQWADAGSYTNGSAPDVSTPGDEIFLSAEAPFGEVMGAVNRSLNFDTHDGTAGCINLSTETLPDHFIPLVNLVSGVTEIDLMLMGVDTRNGIVWMGESQIGNTNRMDDGNVKLIMANLWAWIVDRANP